MRRLARRLFTLCSIVSLLLCAGACVQWVRTTALDRFDAVQFGSSHVARSVIMSGGTLYFRHMTVTVPWWEPQPWSYESQGGTDSFEPSAKLRLDVLGFGLAHKRGTFEGSGFVETWIIAPFWALAIVTAVLPALGLTRRVRQARQARAGLCPACGYDLRASPGRCPECGTPPAPEAGGAPAPR